MSAWDWLAVALLGGVGALARVGVDGLVSHRLSARLARRGEGLILGTLAVNLSGAFLLGLVDGLALSAEAEILLGTATLGAYTTFSTWMLQTQSLAADRARRLALANIGASVLLGFGAMLLGHVIGAAL
jgi:CrcB protein